MDLDQFWLGLRVGVEEPAKHLLEQLLPLPERTCHSQGFHGGEELLGEFHKATEHGRRVAFDVVAGQGAGKQMLPTSGQRVTEQ